MVVKEKQLIDVEEAERIISDNLLDLGIEEIDLSEALERVLVEDIFAPEDSPRYTNSAMDGFAINWDSKTGLEIIGESHAGHPFLGELKLGQAVRISTGAMLPEGANTVVPIENIKLEGGQIRILNKPKKFGEHVRFKGEEIKTGDLIAKAGTKIDPSYIAIFAAFGLARLKVYSRPKVAIILTGTELKAYDSENIEDYEIRESNGLMLASLIKLAKAQLVSIVRVEDDLDKTAEALDQASKQADYVIFSGGVSVGSKDFVKAACQRIGYKQLFWKIKQKPGKPLFFTRKENKIVFGLPGNPVSALFCFTYYIYPMLLKQQGLEPRRKIQKAKLSHDCINKGDRTNFLRACIIGEQVEVLGKQGSHMLSSCSQANAFLKLEPREELNAGDEVEVIIFPWT